MSTHPDDLGPPLGFLLVRIGEAVDRESPQVNVVPPFIVMASPTMEGEHNTGSR
jgi:hypothetical protein